MSVYDAIIIDGRHLLYRVAHVNRHLSVALTEEDDRLPTGAIYGFIKTVLSIYGRHARFGCTLFICWEGGHSGRKQIDPEYKANRTPATAEKLEEIRIMNSQESLLKSIISKIGWAQVVAAGYEADDSMATIASRLSGMGNMTAIYTGDYDLHQAVTADVHCISPSFGTNKASKDQVWNIEKVSKKWGVEPIRVAEYKALAGDSSDNIKGCPKVGDKWAKKILSVYKLEELLEESASGTLSGICPDTGKDWKSNAIPASVVENWETIQKSYQLALLQNDVPVEVICKDPDRKVVIEAFKTFKFISLMRPSIINQIFDISSHCQREYLKITK